MYTVLNLLKCRSTKYSIEMLAVKTLLKNCAIKYYNDPLNIQWKFVDIGTYSLLKA